MESKLAIDEVSETLGSLKSEVTHLKGSDLVIHDKLDKIIDKLTLINGSVGKAHGRIDDLTDPVDGDITVAYIAATDWVETKKKAKWMIFGGSLAGTAGGFSIGKLIAGLFS